MAYFLCVNAGEKLEKAKSLALEYARENFKDVDIIDVVKIPKSFEKNISGDFNRLECKSKGKSSLYLYITCDLFSEEGKLVGQLPITFRIKETTAETVQKNQKISIVYLNKNIKIKLLGVALENGKEGDYIKVKNISTGKELIGKIISSEEVLVEGGR